MSETSAGEPPVRLAKEAGRSGTAEAEGKAPEAGDDARPNDATTTGELRIDASPAGVAAGLMSETSGPTTQPVEQVGDEPAFELPNWADPPTGQVPRVLLEQSDVEHSAAGEVMRGPTWRQESEDFGDAEDLSFLLEGEEASAPTEIAGALIPDERPFEFSFAELEPEPDASSELGPADSDEAAWTTLFEESLPEGQPRSPQHRRHAAHRQRGRSRAGGSARRGSVATLTGIALALVALACFFGGSISTVALVAVATTIAAGEAFAAVRGVGYKPATLLGLLSVPAVVVAAYLHGPTGVLEVAGVSFVALAAWFLTKASGDEPLVNLAVTELLITWVGICGAFAGLLLAPAAHPHRHGVAFVVAIVALVAVDDVGAYAVGAKLGRHRLAPTISPNKTVEGLIGGTVLTFVVAALAVSHLHPLHLDSALGLAGIVSVLAPLGDLLESRIKRDLGVKDMGSLLPSHGGLFDRIDAMVIVLPAAFVLVKALNLQ